MNLKANKLNKFLIYFSTEVSVQPVQASNSTHILHEICPDASGEEIEVALQESGGDPNVAAQSLLGGKQNNYM